MSSVSLPCPVCLVPLILDEENVGQEVICPNCGAQLKMPSKVSASSRLMVLSNHAEIGASQSTAILENRSKSALPQNRSKSVEEERKRLAAAAAASGAAHSFQPDEAHLPPEHRAAVLPSKRTMPVATTEASDAPSTLPPPHRGSLLLPTKRSAGVPLEPRPSRDVLEPIEPRIDIEISPTSLTGPSRFVRSEQPVETARQQPSASAPVPAPVEEDSEELVDPQGPVIRGGFRLGGGRQLHFSPVPVVAADGEAVQWGAKAETAGQAARGRRFVTVAMIIAILTAGSVGAYMFRQMLNQKDKMAALTDDETIEKSQPAEDVMRNVEGARRVLKRFLDAETIEKMAAEVRHPEVTRPRMERYYAANPLKPRKIKTESQTWNELRLGEKEFIRGSLELDDFLVHGVSLELFPASDPKVDWESYVSWAELPWKDFLRTPPKQPVDYRVTVTFDPRDQYYNYSFKGRELDLLCFRLEDPEKYGSCWAYCDKDSETAGDLLFSLNRSRKNGIVNDEGKIAISCMLTLRFPPEGMKTNQVMIEKFLSDNWVQP